jgi:glycogen operon protein
MRAFGMLIDGRAQTTGIKRRGSEATLLLVFNAHHDIVRFTLPHCNGGGKWKLLTDTNVPDKPELGAFDCGKVYDVTARSLLLFVLAPATATHA